MGVIGSGIGSVSLFDLLLTKRALSIVSLFVDYDLHHYGDPDAVPEVGHSFVICFKHSFCSRVRSFCTTTISKSVIKNKQGNYSNDS